MGDVAMMKLPIVGVMGSGTDPHQAVSAPLGRFLARKNVHLLTGGGDGVMRCVSEAFANERDKDPSRRGLILGILPCISKSDRATPKPGYPNEFVEVPIFTHLPFSGDRGADVQSRNHINVLTSDVLIVLPGGAGTASEAGLALRYRKPVIAFLGPDGVVPGLDRAIPVARAIDEVAAFLHDQGIA